MTVIKNGCICGGDYYTTTEQCDDPDCRSERKTTQKTKIVISIIGTDTDSLHELERSIQDLDFKYSFE